MRREGMEEDQELSEDRNRLRFPAHSFIGKNHKRRNRGVKTQPVQVLGDFLDARMKSLELRAGCGLLPNRRTERDSFQELSATLRFGS